ncbi:hypothetical protein Lal_00031523 [Lupinus albus]|nr:hypothetical protein Lal_00031523 [Lupinus albus]
MATIRDIVSDFSDEDDIELIGDEEEEDDVEIGSSELHGNITYANPSGFFTYINSETGRDYRPRSTTLRNDNDLFVGMQFESKELTLDAIKKFHICNSFDYIVVESRSNRYVVVVHIMMQVSWKPRLIQRFSLERERCIGEGEIVGYTGGFSPERELYHPSEK